MANEEITQLTPNDNQNSDDFEENELLKSDDPSIIKTNIIDTMQSAFIDYAMSVIVSRALPDVRDGLKPVHRRIIYAMQDQNMYYNGKFHKCAAVVGEVLKKYHPHGDTSVYDAMVRMAQDFSLRYPLINGQGNFGSIDGDPAAAMRYTECKMQVITQELYRDIDLDTVEFELNDLQNMEPVILPAVVPNILLNGASGIAVGMATNIPPHNLNELIEGLQLLIEKAEYLGETPSKEDKEKALKLKLLTLLKENDEEEFRSLVTKPEFDSKATVEDLVKVVKGPDFPTGGTIYNQKEIMQLYATGKGRIVTRAKTTIEEKKNGRMSIIVTEIPYQVNKSNLIEKIARLVKDKKVKGISDLRDESDRKGMRIVIELKKDALPKKVQNQLFKYSQLQNTFSANMVALLDREPKLMTLKMILEEFIKHRQKVIVRRTIHLLKKARDREHILLGLLKALDIIDEIIAHIRASKTVEIAREGLVKKFEFTEIQAQAILDMQLRRLAALERQKLQDELDELQKTIDGYVKILFSPKEIIKVVGKELEEIKEKYGDERKTKVVKAKAGEFSEEDLTPNENCVVSISKSGYIKRMKENSYKKQGRGGKGVKGQSLKEEDIIDNIKFCSTHDYALFFTNKGKVYKMRIWEIPESSKQAKGTALVNFLSIGQNEKVQAFLTVDKDTMDDEKGNIVLATEKGKVKKTEMKDFANIRTAGIIAIKLATEDCLVNAKLSSGKDEIMLVTSEGQSIRFDEKHVRAMGRTASGVGGIKLKKADDYVVGMDIIKEGKDTEDLVIITEKGYGKKTSLKEYKAQNRGGSGILTYKVTSKTGKVVSAKTVKADSEDIDVLIISESGKVIRIGTKQVPQLGRATLGVKLFKLGASDKVSSATFTDDEDEIPDADSDDSDDGDDSEE